MDDSGFKLYVAGLLTGIELSELTTLERYLYETLEKMDVLTVDRHNEIVFKRSN